MRFLAALSITIALRSLSMTTFIQTPQEVYEHASCASREPAVCW
jgi:hypothetical protein